MNMNAVFRIRIRLDPIHFILPDPALPKNSQNIKKMSYYKNLIIFYHK